MYFKRILDNAAIFALGMAMGHGSWFVAFMLVICSVIFSFVNSKEEKA